MGRLHQLVIRKSLAGTILYGLSVPLAFLSVYVSLAIFVVIPAMFFLPDRLPSSRSGP